MPLARKVSQAARKALPFRGGAHAVPGRQVQIDEQAVSAQAACGDIGAAASLHLPEHFGAIGRERGQAGLIRKPSPALIGPQAVRRQYEDVVRPVVFFEALIEQPGIDVERYAFIADEHVIVRRAVAVQNLFDAALIFSVVLNSQKGDQRFPRQGIVILHISVAHVKQEAGQEKSVQRDEQHKHEPAQAGPVIA